MSDPKGPRFHGVKFKSMYPEKFAHPLVRDLFQYCRIQMCSITKLAEKVGGCRNTIYRWKAWNPNKTDWNGPSLKSIDDCFTAMGLRLIAIPEEWCPGNGRRVITDVAALEKVLEKAQKYGSEKAFDPAEDVGEEESESELAAVA